MSILDTVRRFFNPPYVPPVITPIAPKRHAVRVKRKPSSQKRQIENHPLLQPVPLPSGRTSVNAAGQSLTGSGWTLIPPSDHERNWRLQNLDVQHLDIFTPRELLYMLCDLSPEVSAAHWHFNRMCNPGYEVKAYNLGSEDVENTPAKEHIDLVFAILKQKYGATDIVINRFFTGAFFGGAVVSELVLDGGARETLDLVSPDPYSIQFRKKPDALFKEIWEPGQQQGRDFVSLNIPTFKYLPVDPMPASPYGRPLASPALFSAIFSLSIMHDVKRVIMQQGYKRMVITLDTEKAMDAYSFDPQDNASYGAYIAAAMEQVRTTYGALEPDDALMMTDIFKVLDPAGTIDSDSMLAIDAIIQRLEKKLTIALKSNGVVMDTSNNTNESDSNRKWEIFVAGIKSIQHLVENMMEAQLTNSLQAVGIQARVVFRFSELRASEMLRDEQTRAMRIQNARNEYAAGFESQDAASEKTVGHKADVPEPREPLDSIQDMNTGDNNDGEEALNQNSDDRAIDLSPKPVILPAKERTNGHSKTPITA